MPRGVADLERPRRIAHAALRVVGERGVEGLTHRAVAAEAGIPLGSTTYHFRTLDDLLAAAIVEAKAATDAELADWGDAITGQTDLVEAMADYLFRVLRDHWDRTVLELELYMAALRRPSLRELSKSWDQTMPEVLERHVDVVTARAMALVYDGLVLQAVIHGMPGRDEVRAVLRRTVQ